MIPDYSYLSHQLSHQTTGSTSSSSPLSTYSEKSYDRSSPLSRDEFAAVKLSDVLSVLDEEDESCIFIVRRVSKLGYAARDALDRYFSWHYGPVKRILLLPSRGKEILALDPPVWGLLLWRTEATVSGFTSRLTRTVSMALTSRYSALCGMQKFKSLPTVAVLQMPMSQQRFFRERPQYRCLRREK